MTRRRILLARSAQESGILATATGNPMTFTTDLVRRLHSLAIPFTPIQAGSGDPSSENIRPISGLTDCNVFVRRKNLFDGEWELGTWNTNTGVKGNSNNDIRCKNLIAAPSGVTINFSRTDTSVSFYALFVAYKKDKSYSRYLGARSSNSSITLAADEGYFTFYLYARTTPLENAMFEVTTQANPTYEAYQAKTIPISWQDDVGIIYGSTVTLNDDGSADLLANWWGDVLDGTKPVPLPNWMPSENTSAWLYNENQFNVLPSYSVGNVISDKLKNVSYSAVYGGTVGISTLANGTHSFAVRVPVSGLTSEALINAYLAENPIQIVYRMNNTQTYHFDGVQQIVPFLGTNTIWTDTNGTNTAEYWIKNT